jgi:dynein heavy chain
MKGAYKLAGQTNENPNIMNEWFFNRIKDNMHLSVCMSPVGDKFKDYTRNYPALINNTTIDWFMAWPEEALVEVAKSYLQEQDIEDQYKEPLSHMCAYTFASAT